MKIIIFFQIMFFFRLSSKRFDKVHEDAKNIWYDQKYHIVREYYHRTALFSPLNIFGDIYKLFILFINWIQKKRNLPAYKPTKVFSMS